MFQNTFENDFTLRIIMKILHIIPSVDPKGGGPIEGVNQLSAVHRELGIEVEICSLDKPDSECVRNSQTNVHALGPVAGNYGYSRRLVPWLKTHAHKYTAVIVNGLWQYTGFAVWCALSGSATPYYVFTHGMLDPWFKHAYPLKHFKKWMYWPWAEYRVLRDARRVIFTCEEERLLARESFWLYKVNESVTSFGVSNTPENDVELAAKFLKHYPHLRDKRIVLYLSRIHVKKGCDILIDAFAKVAKWDVNLHLVIAGPDQTGWVSKLRAQADALGIAHRLTWSGMLQGDMKWGAFYAAEIFCLPSHQENFGIVVAEALACGKPVLISNRVNIWREIEVDGAGFVDDDTVEGTVRNLEKWLAMDSEGYAAMSERAISCFKSRFHVQKAAERLLEIINES
jgi:glycosyltransferase involved in cell wall biosynthesis